MAYRLLNCCDQALRVDLRGGETLLLEAGALSPVLREELLYDNVFVEQWLGQGLLQRLPASLSEAEVAAEPVPEEIADEQTDPEAKAATKATAATRKAPAAKARNGKGDSP